VDILWVNDSPSLQADTLCYPDIGSDERERPSGLQNAGPEPQGGGKLLRQFLAFPFWVAWKLRSQRQENRQGAPKCLPGKGTRQKQGKQNNPGREGEHPGKGDGELLAWRHWLEVP
jgi:hypothetical protein